MDCHIDFHQLEVVAEMFGINGIFVKLVTVSKIPSSTSVVWLDDELTEEAKEWARTRAGATLLVDVDPSTGLTHEDLEKVSSF